MLNARCYFHFSPDVLNTVVCCFADCYNYCRSRDVLSNKAINQLRSWKTRGVHWKHQGLLCCCCGFICGDREQVGAGKQAACGWSQKGFSPSCHVLPSASDPELAPAQAFSRTCASFLSLPIPHTRVGSAVQLLESLEGQERAIWPMNSIWPFFFCLFLFSGMMWNSHISSSKAPLPKGNLGVIPEALTPVVSTSPSPSSSVTGETPPGAGTLTGEDGSDLEIYSNESFGTQWQIL